MNVSPDSVSVEINIILSITNHLFNENYFVFFLKLQLKVELNVGLFLVFA